MSANIEKLPPMHPGEVLREEFFVPMGLSAYAVAKAVYAPDHRPPLVERSARPARCPEDRAEGWVRTGTRPVAADLTDLPDLDADFVPVPCRYPLSSQTLGAKNNWYWPFTLGRRPRFESKRCGRPAL